MGILEACLRRGLVARGDDFELTLDPAFQGLPDTAHGGSVLALFHALSERRGAARARGRYHRRVPLGVPLLLTVDRTDRETACRLLDVSGGLLVDGTIGPASAALDATPVAPPPGDADALPISSHCFVCGVDSAIGLRARPVHDAGTVTVRWTPREGFATLDGRLAPIALTALLDEAAFWLGALASGESGMTTALDVTMDDAVAFGGVTVQGRRDRVRRRADDARYWETEIEARDERGRAVARAAITFVAVRGAARRLVAGLSALNPPDVVARVFPSYAR